MAEHSARTFGASLWPRPSACALLAITYYLCRLCNPGTVDRNHSLARGRHLQLALLAEYEVGSHIATFEEKNRAWYRPLRLPDLARFLSN